MSYVDGSQAHQGATTGSSYSDSNQVKFKLGRWKVGATNFGVPGKPDDLLVLTVAGKGLLSAINQASLSRLAMPTLLERTGSETYNLRSYEQKMLGLSHFTIVLAEEIVVYD